jgi:two-component system, LytTR family, response regulator
LPTGLSVFSHSIALSLTAIIVEDEIQSQAHLQALLTSFCPEVRLLAVASTVKEGIQLFQLHRPDLLFLDIELGTASGFDILTQIAPASYHVIFTTAFDQYGVRAIKFSALDYLLKPIQLNELRQAVEKALLHHFSSTSSQCIQHFLDQLHQQKGQEKTLAIAQGREHIFIQVSDIKFCEASNNYTTLHLQQGNKLVSSKGIFHYDELLSPIKFFRVHQSYLVNLRYVRSLHTEQYLLLQDATRIPVARLKMPLVRQALLDQDR